MQIKLWNFKARYTTGPPRWWVVSRPQLLAVETTTGTENKSFQGKLKVTETHHLTGPIPPSLPP